MITEFTRPHFPRRYLIGLLLLAVTSIANIDRMNMSVAAPTLQSQFHLSDFQLGLVLSSFFWTYTAFLPLAGLLLDRFGKSRILILAVLLWTLTSSAMALVISLPILFAIRLLLGIGESPCFPSCNLVIREWSPLRERGLFTALMQAGALLGPGIAAAPAAYLIQNHGWRLSFIILSSLGFLWLLIWFLIYAPPERAAWISDSERTHILTTRKPPIHTHSAFRISHSAFTTPTPMTLPSIAAHRSFIGIFLAIGPLTYALYFLLTWLPGYLTKSERHFDLLKSGSITSAIFLLATAGTITLGLLSDKFLVLSHEQSARGTRRYAVVIAILLAALPISLTPFIANQYLLIAADALALTMVATAISLLYALTTDLIVDEPSAGRTFALVSFAGQPIGFASPALTGLIAQYLGFTPAFFITALLLALGSLSALLLPTRQFQPRP